jgi:hypothetical protein
MIELQRSPSHPALASDGSNAYQSIRQGAQSHVREQNPIVNAHRKEGVEKPPRVFASQRLRTR